MRGMCRMLLTAKFLVVRGCFSPSRLLARPVAPLFFLGRVRGHLHTERQTTSVRLFPLSCPLANGLQTRRYPPPVRPSSVLSLVPQAALHPTPGNAVEPQSTFHHFLLRACAWSSRSLGKRAVAAQVSPPSASLPFPSFPFHSPPPKDFSIKALQGQSRGLIGPCPCLRTPPGPLLAAG
jgi:hypothetical protein